MKQITVKLTLFLSTIALLSGQSTEELTDDQKKEYNRTKITVEKVTEQTGGMGWYWSFFSKRVDTWRAFKGLSDYIEAEEFFTITGYDEEANKVKTRLATANGNITLGIVVYLGGLVGMYYEKEEVTTDCYDLIGCYDYSEYSYPFVLPGAIAAIGGLYLWYKGTLEKLKPVAPYESAAAIADEFNKDLIERIQK